ncbi:MULTISPECIES: NUDIX hydrolase [Solibacillus]|uniref:NUDIX hydrolase n=1 Tax=Solibacillus merdavium TaxID=2762218 RepID=A0ABR8XK84_9BACL|nr:NUDIX hydrolase [Solibacillus merdavium]MBD8032344.1 NUDIX hydrolase [Solibacillus merdavium]
MDYIETLRQYIGERPIIAPGSAVIILNDNNELLLQLREDTNDWGLPGGGMELGDSFEETAQKELHEETGLNAEELKLIGIASGKETYYKYPNGDEIYNATAIYEAIKITGNLKEKDETKALQYFPLDNLPQLNYISKIFLKKIGYIS